MPYGFQILSEEPLNQFGDNYVLNRGQMLTEVKCSKVCFAIRSLGLKHHQAIKMVTALKRMLPPNFACVLAKGTVMSCFCFCFVLFCFFNVKMNQFEAYLMFSSSRFQSTQDGHSVWVSFLIKSKMANVNVRYFRRFLFESWCTGIQSPCFYKRL